MAFLNESAFVAIGFALFVILVWRKAGAAISTMLDDRTNKIKAELDEAQSLRDEAAAELAKYCQRLAREAADEAKMILQMLKAQLHASQKQLRQKQKHLLNAANSKQQLRLKLQKLR